jgi:hemerythrin superfamily protein
VRATELLKQDHTKVKQLFTEFQGSQSRRIGDTICQELEVHAAVEEEIFYPAAQAKGGELASMVREGIQEHQKAKSLIAEIRSASDDGQYRSKLNELQQNIEHHVQEEEGELFPKVEQQMASEADQLGQQMQERKQALSGVSAR